MTERVGDWNRPCTACKKTPQDGAVFYGRTNNKASRLSQCSKCMNRKYRVSETNKANAKIKRELNYIQMEMRVLQGRKNSLINLIE